MKKRLRKKYHKGEFKQEGFTILLQLNLTFSPNDLDNTIDTVFKVIQDHNCYGAGGGDEQFITITIVPSKRKGTITEELKQSILNQILLQTSAIKNLKSFPLRDCWYITDEEFEKEHQLIQELKETQAI